MDVFEILSPLAFSGWYPTFISNLWSMLTSSLAFDCIRIWGITQHQWVPTMIVFCLGMFDPVINIVSISYYIGFGGTNNIRYVI